MSNESNYPKPSAARIVVCRELVKREAEGSALAPVSEETRWVATQTPPPNAEDEYGKAIVDQAYKWRLEAEALMLAATTEQGLRRRYQGELNMLKGRLESVLSRLEDKWDCKVNPQTCTAEQQNAALDITTTIRKELES